MTWVSWFAAVAAMSTIMSCTGNDPRPAATPQRPLGFRFEAIGGRSFASFGWAGTQHDIDVPEGTPFSVAVDSCQGSDGPCLFHGPVQLPGDLQRERCLNRMSQACTTDQDCKDPQGKVLPGSCVFIYDPPTTTPLPTAVGAGPGGPNFGACAWTYIPLVDPFGQPAIVGSIDQTSGEVTLERLLVYLALNGRGGATPGGCEVCSGDNEVANDGTKGGTCKPNPNLAAPNITETSPDNGQPCDINRDSKLPGFNSAGYSMDCSPSFDPTSTPTPIGGPLSTADLSIATSDGPQCTFAGASSEKCFCGVCTDNSGDENDGIIGCHTTTDCPAGQTCGMSLASCSPGPDGTCTKGLTFEVGTRPNLCTQGCVWNDVTGQGHCMENDQIKCYPGGKDAVIHSKGSHLRQDDGSFVIDTANATCNGATKSGPLNLQVGLPGLTFQKRSFRVIPRFPGEL